MGYCERVSEGHKDEDTSFTFPRLGIDFKGRCGWVMHVIISGAYGQWSILLWFLIREFNTSYLSLFQRAQIKNNADNQPQVSDILKWHKKNPWMTFEWFENHWLHAYEDSERATPRSLLLQSVAQASPLLRIRFVFLPWNKMGSWKAHRWQAWWPAF